MINHDKYMMINFLIFYEFFYKKYYFLTKNELEILHEKIRFLIEKISKKIKFFTKRTLEKINEKPYEKFYENLMKNLIKNLMKWKKFLGKDIFKIMYNNNIQLYNFFNSI